MYDNKNYQKLFLERINNISEPVLDCSVLSENELRKIKDLLENYNLENRTSFWLDEKTKEIVDTNILNKEKNILKLKRLAEYFENTGFDKIAITESVASRKNTIERLYESEIEKAEIILATQLIVDRLQKIIENLSSIIYEEIIPISDKIKIIFGKNTSNYWTDKVKNSLDNLVNQTIETKDIIFKVNSELEKFSWSGKELNDMNTYDEEKEKEEKEEIKDKLFSKKDSDEKEKEKKENKFRELKNESLDKDVNNRKTNNKEKSVKSDPKRRKVDEALKIIIEDLKEGFDFEKAVKSASFISGLDYNLLIKIAESLDLKKKLLKKN